MTTSPRGLLIDGKETPASTGKTLDRRNPADGSLVATYAEAGAADVENAIRSARRAFAAGPWRQTNGADRAALLSRVAALIRRETEPLAQLETRESGKPIAQARAEMDWAAGLWDYAAALARQLSGDSYNTLGPAALGLTVHEPIGVIALITPWNFPLLIVSQKLPFALAAGCTCVVKPSEFTSGTTLRLAGLLLEAGLPAGVCNVLTGYGEPVGRLLSEHPDVDMISFTGSTAVGKRIVAASQGNLKKVTLELGGKNPQIVFPDADLEAALDAVVFGVYFNAGECCNSGSRLLLHRDVPPSFVERIVERARSLPVGDPLNERTKVGAIINAAQFAKITDYITAAKKAGARLLLGGDARASGGGHFVDPTVFAEVRPEMSIAREEIFGPVLSILRFDTVEEATALANDTMYGLSAAVWTRDLDRALGLARGIQAGTVWVNTFMEGPAEMPFGGYRQSGLGRELGRRAVEDYTQTKAIQIHLGARTSWWHPA